MYELTTNAFKDLILETAYLCIIYWNGGDATYQCNAKNGINYSNCCHKIWVHLEADFFNHLMNNK